MAEGQKDVLDVLHLRTGPEKHMKQPASDMDNFSKLQWLHSHHVLSCVYYLGANIPKQP